MRVNRRSITLFGFAAGLLIAISSAIPAQAQEEQQADPDTIVVCDGNSLSLLDADGARLPQERIVEAVQQIDVLCDAGVGSTMSFEEFDARASAPGFQSYANVVAQITNKPGSLGVSAYANSIPKDGQKKDLSCIYRNQPFSGPATSWMDCGSRETTYETYLTTRGNIFCPVPGSRWEAYAALYVNGRLRQDDSDIAIAL